jgi:hypothetical protein
MISQNRAEEGENSAGHDDASNLETLDEKIKSRSFSAAAWIRELEN